MKTLLVLTAGQTDVQLVDADARRELKRECCAFLHDEIERRGRWRVEDAPLRKGDPAEHLPEGDVILCTPKLDAVLQYLAGDSVVPATVLIFATRRDAVAERGDPRFAAPILERRLRDKGTGDIHCTTYLASDERLENRQIPQDAIVRREVVRRLDRAVREGIGASSPDRIIVANTGGLPAVSELVEEILKLHGPAIKVHAVEIADGSRTNPPLADRAVPRTTTPEPLLSIRARRQALELIENGNLLGAWAIAQPLDDDPVERQWTEVVEWLRAFASSCPISPTCDIPVLTPPRLAVRAAIRVELALRADDLPRAVHGTVAFFEAAFWDWIKAHDFGAEGIRRLSDTEYQLPASPSKDQKARFRKTRINDFADGIDAWLSVLKRPALAALWRALTEDIKNLRNDVAHNEPTEALMEDARRLMRAGSLWSSTDSFLTQPLVVDVLRELGERNPSSLCNDMIATVRTRLLRLP